MPGDVYDIPISIWKGLTPEVRRAVDWYVGRPFESLTVGQRELGCILAHYLAGHWVYLWTRIQFERLTRIRRN